MPIRDHDESMAEIYREQPDLAADMLNELLKDGEPGEMLILMRQLTKSFGGIQTVAEKSDLNPTQLYRTLSANGNPSLHGLIAMLKAMGLRLAVAPLKDTKRAAKPSPKPKSTRAVA